MKLFRHSWQVRCARILDTRCTQSIDQSIDSDLLCFVDPD